MASHRNAKIYAINLYLIFPKLAHMKYQIITLQVNRETAGERKSPYILVTFLAPSFLLFGKGAQHFHFALVRVHSVTGSGQLTGAQQTLSPAHSTPSPD